MLCLIYSTSYTFLFPGGLIGEVVSTTNEDASRFAEKRLMTRSFAALSIMQLILTLIVGSDGGIDQLVWALSQGYRPFRL